MLRFEDLTYSDAELEKDAIHYLETQIYAPSYIEKVKKFIHDDLIDFKHFYDDADHAFCNIYYDEYVNGYKSDDDVMPKIDFRHLIKDIEKNFSRLDVDEDEIENYTFFLDAEFRKNAYCSHMEPYFVGYTDVVATVITGYSRNPIFSIYAMVREWGMALHLKKMYPTLMKKFGYQLQKIRMENTGEERLRKLVDYREKYKHTFQNIGILRAIHSSVFAYAYLFLSSVRTKEVLTAEEFIMENSSSKISLLLQGESIRNFDFPVTKYVLDKLKDGHYKELMYKDGRINWEALYLFTLQAMKDVDADSVHFWGFDSIEAKTMQEFWNKSPNMQSMLKILRQLAMDNNNPVFNRLIEGCEYRLGRPDKAKLKMERFIEYTRKIMAARAYELMKPRTMAQELIAAFPSVFLVYFQWHHNFRNIYPRIPQKKINEEYNRIKQVLKKDAHINKLKIDRSKNILKDVLKQQKADRNLLRDKKNKRDSENNQIRMNEEKEKIRLIMMNKERTLAEMSLERNNKQKISRATMVEMVQRQNSM